MTRSWRKVAAFQLSGLLHAYFKLDCVPLHTGRSFSRHLQTAVQYLHRPNFYKNSRSLVSSPCRRSAPSGEKMFEYF